MKTFLFLRGTGTAYCDDISHRIQAGDFLVLPAESVHRVVSSDEEKLYAITTMTPGHGFAALVAAGEAVALQDDELAVLAKSAAASTRREA